MLRDKYDIYLIDDNEIKNTYYSYYYGIEFATINKNKSVNINSSYTDNKYFFVYSITDMSLYLQSMYVERRGCRKGIFI